MIIKGEYEKKSEFLKIFIHKMSFNIENGKNNT